MHITVNVFWISTHADSQVTQAIAPISYSLKFTGKKLGFSATEDVGFFPELSTKHGDCHTEVLKLQLLFLWSGKAIIVESFWGSVVGLGLLWFFFTRTEINIFNKHIYFDITVSLPDLWVVH